MVDTVQPVFTIGEIEAMTPEELHRVLAPMLSEIASRRAQNAANEEKIKRLEIACEELKSLLDSDSDEDVIADTPVPKVLPNPPEFKTRFQGMTQEQAVDVILKERHPNSLKSRQIAKQLASGGYAYGKKSAKDLVGGVNNVLSKGWHAGRYLKVGYGAYQWNISNESHAEVSA